MNEASKKLFSKDYDLLEKGKALTEERAKVLETNLKANPQNISERLQLIGFYRRKMGCEKLRAVHLFWMIENCPDNQVWRHIVLMGFTQNNTIDEVVFAKEAWSKKANSNPANSDIVGNAGMFLIESEFDIGKELLTRACSLSPNDDFWPAELSQFCFWQAQTSEVNRFQNFEAALDSGERFLFLYGSEGGRKNSAIRWRAHLRCALSALELKKFDHAKQHATSAFESCKNDDVIPKASLSILGLIALQNGSVDEAKKQLLELDQKYDVDSTDLRLANELVKMGHSSTVIEYLSKCKSRGLWKNRPIDGWIEELKHNFQPVLY